MTTPLIVLLSAFLIAIAATPLARYLAVRTGTVDAPAQRKIHSAPMPLLGGLAIYAGCVGALVTPTIHSMVSAQLYHGVSNNWIWTPA